MNKFIYFAFHCKNDKMKQVERTFYLQQLLQWRSKHVIKIIRGATLWEKHIDAH